MKQYLSLILCGALSLLGFAGCAAADTGSEREISVSYGAADSAVSAPVPAQSGEKLRVVSTIFPGYDFARQVAGERAEITMLLPPGSESHSFEPTPQDIIAIQNCDLFLYVGGEGDTWLDGILESVGTDNIRVLSMMEQVDVVTEVQKEGMEPGGHDHDGEEAHNHPDGEDHGHEGDTLHSHGDEHVWTSPANAAIITRSIAAALGELDAENAVSYIENAERYCAELEGLDADFRAVTDSAARRTVIFGDRFPFRYLTEAYGLDYFAAFSGCSTETEASAKTVAFLIDKVKDENIPVVFHIEFSNEKMADTICESTGAKKLLLHSCHNVSKQEFEGGVTYLQLMRENVESLKEALQ